MGMGDPAAGMNVALRAAYETIRDLLAKASRDEVRNRYRAGELVADIKRMPNKYGRCAVAQLATALCQDAQTLYRCATVAECWTASQLEALLQSNNEYGQPLSWSHFVVLAGVTSARERKELFERCVAQSLSVRALTALIDLRRRSRNRVEPSGASAALEQLVRVTQRLVEGASRAHQDLLAELRNAPDPNKVRAQALLERAIEVQERLEAVAREQLKSLRSELASVRAPSDGRETDRLPRLLVGMGPRAAPEPLRP